MANRPSSERILAKLVIGGDSWTIHSYKPVDRRIRIIQFQTTMALKVAIVVCILATATADTKPATVKEKYQVEESRAIESYAQDALSGVYSECISQVSFACLQRKVLQFVHRMSRMEQFNVLGQYLSVVKVRDEKENDSDFQDRVARAEQEDSLDLLMENTIDRFFNNHVIRVRLPSSLVVRGSARSADSIDLQFPHSDDVEGRKKGGGGKMGKKMMMMMMMGLKAKMMMLGPMMMGLAGLMAMKALIAGVVSLTISKIMIIKKLMKQKGGGGGGGHSSGGWESSSGGGGGGGWSSGGGGGYERRSHDYLPRKDGWDASDLAYRAYSTVENLL